MTRSMCRARPSTRGHRRRDQARLTQHDRRDRDPTSSIRKTGAESGAGPEVTIDGMAPRSKAVLAREHLERALPAVAAEDNTEAEAWLFVSLEAVADAQGLDTKKAHGKKAEVATDLHATGVLPTDYADMLKLLNEARKAVFYEGEDPDLGGQSLEDIASTVESAVEQAERVTAR